MNRYFLIRRLRWPAVLLLAGCVALLKQTGVIEHFWNLFVPLLLIVLGLLILAERMSLAAEGDFPVGYPGSPYPGAPPAGAPYQGVGYTGVPPVVPAQPAPVESTSIVPAHTNDFGNNNGGQS
jgi:hypothetical protein